MRPARIHPQVADALAATGLPWFVKNKKRHLMLYVNGRAVGVLDRNGTEGSPRGVRNMVAAIARAARGVQP